MWVLIVQALSPLPGGLSSEPSKRLLFGVELPHTYTHLEREKMVITRVVTLSLWGGILFR